MLAPCQAGTVPQCHTVVLSMIGQKFVSTVPQVDM
jgi:hypothetical protein